MPIVEVQANPYRVPIGSEAAKFFDLFLSIPALTDHGCRSAGRPILEADCQIAAIARARDAAVATRNGADFEHCGIAVIGPWAGDHASP